MQHRNKTDIAEYAQKKHEAFMSTPDIFEPYLEDHPADEDYRETALRWYRFEEANSEKLRHHTLLMMQYHPGNSHIWASNSIEFIQDHDYLKSVIITLEDMLKDYAPTCSHYANISHMYRWAIRFESENQQEWIDFCGLSDNEQASTAVILKDKYEQYLRLALDSAGNDKFMASFISTSLSEFLLKSGKIKEALEVCENASAMRNKIMAAHLREIHGDCLKALGRIAEAKRKWSQVRKLDHCGDNKKPACYTTSAETKLGLAALEERDIESAVKYLLSSCNVQACPHNTSYGLPLILAKRLLNENQTDAVIKFCEKALADFTPDKRKVKDLLDRAIAAAESQRQV